MVNTIISNEQTIIAQCTPQGNGALALLRLSGSNVRALVAHISKLAGNKKIEEVLSHTVHFGWVVDEKGTPIDQVLFIIMDGPRTFTGESTIEITCHNNPFLIEAIIEQAIRHGARVAQAGEFSKRAFLSGKIDLIQAEAIDDLIHANTQAALKKSLAQLEGSFSFWIAEIENKLLKALAFCEASFEFLDEEAEFGTVVAQHISELLATIATIKKTFDIQQQIRQGARIALIGSVNAGKSSIFNALLNQKRAIVSDIAGTTRDVIEAGVYRNDGYWTLIDTAGLRRTDDVIEQEGIKRSWQEAHKADVVLLIFDGSREFTSDEHTIYQEILQKYPSKIILVKNKTDLPQKNTFFSETALAISGTAEIDIKKLEKALENKINGLLDTRDCPFLVNQRQFNLVLELEKNLKEIAHMLENYIHYELVASRLKSALEYLSELTGKSISEMGMDTVFKQFCVGK